MRAIGRRGAYPVVQLSFSGMEHWPFETVWAEIAQAELMAERSPIRIGIEEERQARIRIGAPENTRDAADLDSGAPERNRRSGHPLVARRLAQDILWVTCRHPTPAMAQDAGMSLKAFEDFPLRRRAARLGRGGPEDGADQAALRPGRGGAHRRPPNGPPVRARRQGRLVDDGHMNMPGGEVFYCPVEDLTEGGQLLRVPRRTRARRRRRRAGGKVENVAWWRHRRP